MRVQARELTRTLSGNTASLSSEKGNYMDALVAASLFMIDVSLSALTVSERLMAALLNDHRCSITYFVTPT